MKLTLNYCTINDVMMVDPWKGDDQKKNRKVILHVDEEDFFDMLDSVNQKKKYHRVSQKQKSPETHPRGGHPSSRTAYVTDSTT